MFEVFLNKYNYWFYALMLALGLYGATVKRNLLKKLVALQVFQWSIIFFFLSIGATRGGTIPIWPEHGSVHIQLPLFVNPLPHVLMLTAIVVGVATTGIALSLLLRVYRSWGSLEEDEILLRMRSKGA